MWQIYHVDKLTNQSSSACEDQISTGRESLKGHNVWEAPLCESSDR